MMTRTSAGLSLAAAIAFTAALGAQTTTTTTSQSKSSMDHDQNISVTGCLERDANGVFSLSNARIDPNPATTTATTTAGTTATGTTGTTMPAGEAGSSVARTWKLEGSSSELERHVGHKITVTGHEKSSSAATSTTTGTTATTGTTTEERHSMPERRIDVQSVKMLSSGCS
jgi:hypothetical protein